MDRVVHPWIELGRVESGSDVKIMGRVGMGHLLRGSGQEISTHVHY